MFVALNAEFDDLDLMVESVREWNLDFRLLERGGFAGKIKQLISPDILVGYARFERRLDQAGDIPSGFKTFAIPASQYRDFWWRGKQVTNNDLLAFPVGGELRSASHNDFEIYTVSIRDVLLEQMAEQMRVSKSIGLDDRPEVLRLDFTTMEGLRSLACEIIGSDGGASSYITARRLAERLIALESWHGTGRGHTMRIRDVAIDRVLEYIRSEAAPTSQMSTLCRIGRVSERTLQYAFQERYGVSPGDLVKRWRLNTARRMLLSSDHESLRVGEIASVCGFEHHSQFSVDYRELFAERPSETLRRNTVSQSPAR